jgi:tRNA-specific 2-thiouridylase
MRQKVAIGLSGGVDSSVAAALLLQQGYEVVGVTMRHLPGDTTNSCCSIEAVVDARRVAKKLGIRHVMVDVEGTFYQRVIEPFELGYLQGTTPNPCAMCNRYIKFGAMWDWAREQGCDYLATGHYVRRVDCGDHFELWRARDLTKDQSYLLYSLGQADLAHLLFPLGDYQKTETRALAEEWDLITAQKPDSQELCFVPKNDYAGYLAEHRPESKKPGAIVDRSGRQVGSHQGIAFYTIGQRKGLGITASTPQYVIGLDQTANLVVVGERDDALSSALELEKVHYVADVAPRGSYAGQVKVRYNMQPAPARWTATGERQASVRFDEPQWAITPGQIATLYEGERLVAGGRITRGT